MLATYHLAEGEVIYEICDRAGEPIVLRPAIEVSDSEAADKLVKRLVHLAKYQAAEELDNHDANSELKGKIKSRFWEKWMIMKRAIFREPEAFTDPENPTLNVGEFLFSDSQ